jgi:ribosomal protein S18 acetylase RimI-like enzyme
MGCLTWRVESEPCDGDTWAQLHTGDPVFAYAKIKAENIAKVSQLADAGFRVVDTALTFDRPVSGPQASPRGPLIRFSRPQDREAVSRIAGRSFRFSRFHLDALFPKLLADSIKSSWAGNYFEGKRGDGMVVAERNSVVVGFLQLLWSEPGCLVVDLIGLDSAWQGQGIGRDMILYAALHGTGDGRVPSAMKVGTQAANTPSVRLYESLGFRLTSAHYVMHFHGVTKEHE